MLSLTLEKMVIMWTTYIQAISIKGHLYMFIYILVWLSIHKACPFALQVYPLQHVCMSLEGVDLKGELMEGAAFS